MSKRTVKYYFAYNSPYAFLASTRVDEALAPYDVDLVYRPVYSPRTGGGPDMGSPKMKYLFEDVARFARAYGLELEGGPFADTGNACRGFFFAQENGRGPQYHQGVYRARWLEGKDIGDSAVLASIATACGLDGDAYLAALDDAKYADQLDSSNAESQADGIFGVPTFVLDGERFWGNDRIEWLVKALGGP